jgi:hypothetical protein
MRPLLPSEGRAGIEGEPAIAIAGDDTTPLRDRDYALSRTAKPLLGGNSDSNCTA